MEKVTVLVRVKDGFTGDKLRNVLHSAEGLGMEIFAPVLRTLFFGLIDATKADALKCIDGIEKVETKDLMSLLQD